MIFSYPFFGFRNPYSYYGYPSYKNKYNSNIIRYNRTPFNKEIKETIRHGGRLYI